MLEQMPVLEQVSVEKRSAAICDLACSGLSVFWLERVLRWFLSANQIANDAAEVGDLPIGVGRVLKSLFGLVNILQRFVDAAD